MTTNCPHCGRPLTNGKCRACIARRRAEINAIDYSQYPLGQCEHYHHDGQRCIQPAYVVAWFSTGKKHVCRNCHGRLHAVKSIKVRAGLEECPRCEKWRKYHEEQP